MHLKALRSHLVVVVFVVCCFFFNIGTIVIVAVVYICLLYIYIYIYVYVSRYICIYKYCLRLQFFAVVVVVV